jgi:hypothetical protein
VITGRDHEHARGGISNNTRYRGRDTGTPTPPSMPVVRARRQHAPGEGEQQGPLVDALLGQRCERRARVLRGGGGGFGGGGVLGVWAYVGGGAGARARHRPAAARGEAPCTRGAVTPRRGPGRKYSYKILYILYIAGVVTPRRGPGQRWEASPLAASQESGAEALRVSRCLRSASESLAASAPPRPSGPPPARSKCKSPHASMPRHADSPRHEAPRASS